MLFQLVWPWAILFLQAAAVICLAPGAIMGNLLIPGGLVTVIFTLRVASNITDISSFSFDIGVVGAAGWTLATALSTQVLYNILELPKQLQTTILALIKSGPSTAQTICSVTGKARAVESSYLNQLVVLKLAQKEKRPSALHQGRFKVFFSADLEALDW